MKNFQIRSLAGPCFALLFVFNISLVTIAVIKNDDLYVAYAIVLSCVQFYLYERFKVSRIFFEGDMHDTAQTEKHGHADKKAINYYDINPN
jgi:hypothetical protein